jgi:ribA/ribD-fused uncharacterized protein
MATADQIELAFRAGYHYGAAIDREVHALGEDQALELFRETNKDRHVLDTAGLVCFYEQDFYVLSNFSAFTLEWKSYRFDTLEAAYHWEKFQQPPNGPVEWDTERARIRHRILHADSAHQAFKIAQDQKAYRRPDWDDVKVEVMARLLREKVKQHEYVRRKLLATGERELVENSWRDDFWGWGPNRDGRNMLGRLWMAVRYELNSGRTIDDGWTGQKCPTCKGSQFVRGAGGEDQQCGACGGTGEEYISGLDKRTS